MRTKWKTLLVALAVGLFSTTAFAELGPEAEGLVGINTEGEAHRYRYDGDCPCDCNLFGVELDDVECIGQQTQERLRIMEQSRVMNQIQEQDRERLMLRIRINPQGTPTEEFGNHWGWDDP